MKAWKLEEIIRDRHLLVGKKFRFVGAEDHEIVIAVEQRKVHQNGRIVVYVTVTVVSPEGMDDTYLASPVLRNGDWTEEQ